ncbi:MAG: ergot alkaloid biosynthesis protein [Proteobacteria bacterium]|nr:ergot alkaloid biosynthesis protein [Pseudomonadota bacterium]
MRQQLERAGQRVRAASRTPRNGHGIRFDWADPSTHEHAADGIEAAYLVAPAGVLDLLGAMRPFIDLLLARDVGRLVLLSAASLPRGGPLMGEVHDYLATAAPRWVVLRPSWFMQNFTEAHHRDTILDHDAIYSAAGDGRLGWIDAEDIASVATTCLLDLSVPSFDVVLTGPATHSHDEIGRIIEDAVGRAIAHARIGVDELARRFVVAGLPPAYAQVLAEMDAQIGRGEADFTTPAVERLTGRPPVGFEEFARRHAAAWTRRDDAAG